MQDKTEQFGSDDESSYITGNQKRIEEEEEINEPPLADSRVKSKISLSLLVLFVFLVSLLIVILFFSSTDMNSPPPPELVAPKNILQCLNPKPSESFQYYIIAVTLIKNKRRYVREWLEFHIMMGISHFIFYDHQSKDGLKELLDPYIVAGQVTHIIWPPVEQDLVKFLEWDDDLLLSQHYHQQMTHCRKTNGWECQKAAFDDAIRRTRGKTRWLGAIDVDEYYYLPENSTIQKNNPSNPLAAALRNSEEYMGVTIYGEHFGTNGWYSPPRRHDRQIYAPLVTKTHTRHMSYKRLPLGSAQEHWKPFVNPYCVYGNEVDIYSYDTKWIPNRPWKYYHHVDDYIYLNHYQWPSKSENDEKVLLNRNPETAYTKEQDLVMCVDDDSPIDYLLQSLELKIKDSAIHKPASDGHKDDWDYTLTTKHKKDSFTDSLAELCVILINPQNIGLVRHALSSIIYYFDKVESSLKYKLIVQDAETNIQQDLDCDFPVDAFVTNTIDSCEAEFILKLPEASFARWAQWPKDMPVLHMAFQILKSNPDINMIYLGDSSNSLSEWTLSNGIAYRENPKLLNVSGAVLTRKVFSKSADDRHIYEMCLHKDDACVNNRVRGLFDYYQQERMYDYGPFFPE